MCLWRPRYLSTIDLKNGYWDVPLTDRSRPLTTFTVLGKGLFEVKVAPNAIAYRDDIVICTQTLEEHVDVLRKIFQKLHKANLRPNPGKCQSFRPKLKYLGRVVDKNGLHTDPDKVAAIQNTTPPRNLKKARRFLGLIFWYRCFIKGAACLSSPLHKLLKKKAKWEWTEAHQESFDPDWPNHWSCRHIIAYTSRSVSKTERNYSTTELECLAVKWGIWRMRDYLERYSFTVLTDHLSLIWLDEIGNPSGRLARWAMGTLK